MKSANDMRDIALSRAGEVLDKLVETIEHEAQRGSLSCDAWFDVDAYDLTPGKIYAVTNELRKNGYTVKSKTYYDQRDGNQVKFTVKW